MSSGEVRTEDVRFNCREDSRKRHCLTIRRDSTSETADMYICACASIRRPGAARRETEVNKLCDDSESQRRTWILHSEGTKHSKMRS